DLPLRKPAIEGLVEAGYKVLGEIMERQRDDLLEVKGFGESSLTDLEKFLNKHGLTYEKFEESQVEAKS
ncbi:hypothetical protein KAU08_04210, partial [bacterium]|nr:hypothetical protein [bacterium]